MNPNNFGFKDLKVWQRALHFANNVMEITESLNTKEKHYRLIEQIESASASFAQNTCPMK